MFSDMFPTVSLANVVLNIHGTKVLRNTPKNVLVANCMPATNTILFCAGISTKAIKDAKGRESRKEKT